MRHGLTLLALSYAFGLALGDRCPELALGACWLAWVACGAGALSARAPRARAALALVAVAAAGAAQLGTRVSRAVEQLAAPAHDAILEGRVDTFETRAGGALLELSRVAWVARAEPAPTRCLVQLDAAATPPAIGAWIRIAVRLREVRGGVANPGGRDSARGLLRRGIGCSARALDPALLRVLEDPTPNPLNSLANRRRLAIARLNSFGRGGALLAALGLGDASALPERDRRAWAVLGIAHILSVSGLHLALAAAGAYALVAGALRRCAGLAARRDTRRIALAVALAAAALYAALAGGATPALRSLVMLAALAAAFAARRAVAPASSLALAALIVLALDPAALFAPGAQLSFAATAALVLGHTTDAERRRAGLRRTLAALLATAARASLATAALAALHFGASPPLAGVANVIAVPVTGFFAMPVAFASCSLALLPRSEPLASLLPAASAVAEWLLDAVLALAAYAPHTLPQPPSRLALALWAALTAVALRSQRLARVVVAAFVAQAALAWLPPPALSPAPPRIVFLDVGHGDAVLVEADGFAGLIDAGTATPDGFDAGARVVAPALAALGVRRLDFVAVSHADLDHRGGVPAVLAAFPVGELWLPRGARGDAAFAPLLAEARARGVAVRERGAGDPPLARGALRVTPLWPPRAGAALSDNDRSLVLRVDAPRFAALLLGDLEAAGEAALLASGAHMRADLVKLAHHGSGSSSSAALLDAVEPRLAVASAPLHGRFAWPDADVLGRLAARRTPLAWTGRDGALVVPLAGRACVRRWRAGEACRALGAERSGRRG